MNARPSQFGRPTGGAAELSDRDFGRIAALARSEYGIQIEPQKKSMIQSRLSKRLRALGMTSFSQYCDRVERSNSDERQDFITAITTNVTNFYREVHHFKQLQDEVLPPLVERARKSARIRIWSAGCSTGPEPYSIAGSVLKVMPDAARYDLRVFASDLDRDVLAKAEAAEYQSDQAEVPGPEWGHQVFDRVARGTTKKVRADVADLVSFQQVNLNGTWPSIGKFDVIFCRNVAIYFDREVQQRLWQRFVDLLPPGGMLFIGHSERISGPAKDLLEPSGITAYRKRA